MWGKGAAAVAGTESRGGMETRGGTRTLSRVPAGCRGSVRDTRVPGSGAGRRTRLHDGDRVLTDGCSLCVF
jgi:hypothetical protein